MQQNIKQTAGGDWCSVFYANANARLYRIIIDQESQVDRLPFLYNKVLNASCIEHRSNRHSPDRVDWPVFRLFRSEYKIQAPHYYWATPTLISTPNTPTSNVWHNRFPTLSLDWDSQLHTSTSLTLLLPVHLLLSVYYWLLPQNSLLTVDDMGRHWSHKPSRGSHSCLGVVQNQLFGQ